MDSSRGAIPRLEEAEIEKRVGSRGLRRGWEYFQRGAIRHLRRRGKTLLGLCKGTNIHPYRVRVVFNETGIAEADCTCPIGEGGCCKHVAAILIAWRERPEDFIPVEDIETVLRRCTRQELIGVVQKLVELRPELEEIVYRCAPVSKPDRRQPDPNVYRSQVKAILTLASRAGPPDWKAVADRLMALVEIARSFVHQQELEQAAVIYGAVLEEILASEHVDQMLRGQLQEVVDACVEGFHPMLADQEVPPEVRTRSLKILLAVLRVQLELTGALREDIVELFLRQTNATQKSLLRQWIESLMGQASSQASRRAWGAVLLELSGQEGDFENFARICRITGRYFDLVRRLVCWGQVEEALREADHLEEDELLQLGELLVARGQSAEAEQLVQKRLADRTDGPLAEWLAQHRRRQEHQHQLVELAEQMFRLQPSFEAFLQLREAARSVDRWDQLRSEVLLHLERTGQWGLLARIFLEEKELGRALALLQTHPAKGLEPWETEIAQAAERLYPMEALEIYRQRVERLVELRNPQHYGEVCRLLRKIRSLMKRCGTAQQWPVYLADFRTRYRGLPGLEEQLSKARL